MSSSLPNETESKSNESLPTQTTSLFDELTDADLDVTDFTNIYTSEIDELFETDSVEVVIGEKKFLLTLTTTPI